MTLVEYLDMDMQREAAASWPGTGATWRLLVGIARGFSIGSLGGAGREELLNCCTVLRRIVDDSTLDPMVQADATCRLTGAKRALHQIDQLDPDAERSRLRQGVPQGPPAVTQRPPALPLVTHRSK